ncbi:MAG: radical SAM protein [Candidatus Omnitrophota bacterium]|jgi:hypothetical protein
MFDRQVKTICPVCNKGLDGRYYEEGGRILFEKKCGEHGKVLDLVSSDAELFKERLSLYDHIKGYGCDIPKCREGIFKCAAHLMRRSPVTFIEITTRCNMKCPVCYADAGATGRDVPYEDVCRMLEAIAKEDKETHLVLTGGEPTIHPDFFRIAKKAEELGLIRRTFVATNCITIADKDFCRKVFDAGIRKFYFGFDGTDPEACRKLRGSLAAYESVRKALQNIRELGKAWIILSFTASKQHNLDNIPEAIKFAMDNQDIVKRLMITTECFSGRITDVNDLVNKRLTGDCVEDFICRKIGAQAVTFPLTAFHILMKPLKYAKLIDADRWVTSTFSPMCGQMGMIISDNGKLKSMIDLVVRDPRKNIYKCAREIDMLANRMKNASWLAIHFYYLPRYFLTLLSYMDKKFIGKAIAAPFAGGFNLKKIKKALLGEKRVELYYLLGSDKYNFIWDRMPHCATHHYRIHPTTKQVIKVPGCLVFAFREELKNY